MFAKIGGFSANETIKKLISLYRFANLQDDDLQILVSTRTEKDKTMF